MSRWIVAAALVVSALSPACGLEPGNAPKARDAARPVATAPGPIETLPLRTRPGSTRYVVLGRRSRLDVMGHDNVFGNHHLTFRRWWARIETEPPTVVVEIDLRSVDSEEGLLLSIVRDDMLEANRYPHATLTGSLGSTSRTGNIVIDGVADIHGKQVPLRFTGAIREEGAGYRFKASFDMSRRAFGVGFAPVEPFLDDTFRVSVDAVASEERVDVEEGG